MSYRLKLSNRTDDQIRTQARAIYADWPVHLLRSVESMNRGTEVAEKGITREVAMEILEERGVSKSDPCPCPTCSGGKAA